MSFGRRLALFFVLIALVPTLALTSILVLVSDDSRRGKADARLAAGLETALGVYDASVEAAAPAARRLARDPDLAISLRDRDRAGLEDFAAGALEGDVVAVEVLDLEGAPLAAAGPEEAIAFDRTTLNRAGAPAGELRVSVTTAVEYAKGVEELTDRDVVLSRAGEPLGSTVVPPENPPAEGETSDLDLEGEQLRARGAALDAAESVTLLLIGPREEGGLLAIDRRAAALLGVLLLVGLVLAYGLARTLSRLHTRVAEQALIDPLTGLWNRRRLGQMLEQEVLRAYRFGHALSLLIVDVDDFKRINDERGHPQGDAVLRRLGEIVGETTRAIDLGARYGGDELALILIETDAKGARVVANRLRKRAAEQELEVADGKLTFTISVGGATLPHSAEDLEGLVEAADRALLRAKRKGKNRTAAAPKRRKRPVRAAG